MAPVAVIHDYYAILQVSNTATEQIIKTSYRKLALAHHPDKQPDNPNATAVFLLLQAAYETLSDPVRRKTYDIKWPSIKALAARNKPSNKDSETEKEKQNAEERRTAEIKRRTEERRQAEEKCRAEEKRQAEEFRQAEERRQAEEKQRAEDLCKAEEDKKAELKRRAEESRRAAQEWKAELERQAKEARYYEEQYTAGELPEQDQKAEANYRRYLKDRIDWRAEIKRDMLKLQRMVGRLEMELEDLQKDLGKGVPLKQTALPPDDHPRQVRDAWWAANRAKQTADNTPTPENEQLYRAALQIHRGALRKFNKTELWKRNADLKTCRTQLDEVRAEISELKRRTTKQKRQACCTHRSWWEQLEGLYICPHKECEDPKRRFILHCPICGLLSCAVCKVKSDRAKR